MRKWKILVILLLLLLCLCSCSGTSNYTPPEQPHLYWKTVTAVVTDNDVRRQFAGTHYARVITTAADMLWEPLLGFFLILLIIMKFQSLRPMKLTTK